MSNAEHYHAETMEIFGVKVSVTSYKIGESFYCHVQNVDPGATISRAEAGTREEAVDLALRKAKDRLAGTPTQRR